MKTYRGGIDIGSTTVKLVVLDDSGQIVFGDYRRHHAHTQQTLNSLLKSVRQKLGECDLKLRITGSGSINLGRALGIGFVQEVVAVATALKAKVPQTDVAIELGGEDAKIIHDRVYIQNFPPPTFREPPLLPLLPELSLGLRRRSTVR